MDSRADLLRIPGSWLADSTGTGAWVHFPAQARRPQQAQVELTVRSRCFAPYRRGLGYIHVFWFCFEHGATNFPRSFWDADGFPQAGIVSTRAGHHWVIAGCEIRYGNTIGLDLGDEGPNDADGLGQPRPPLTGYHFIFGNTLSDNGSAGIMGLGSTETRIVGNLIERNNRLGFTAPEIGGIKLHKFNNGLIAKNLIRHNHGYGIWLDHVWDHSRVTRNLVLANQGAGIFIELGRGPLLVDNNIVALTHNSMAINGDGVYSHDASGVTFVHNLLYGNANFGLWMHLATDRGEQQASDWKIANNMFFANHAGALALPAVSAQSRANFSDYNLFAGVYDRFSSETSAKGLDMPWFRILTNKERVDTDSLYQAVSQATGISTASDWIQRPFLSLEAWTSVTGWDANSHYPLVMMPHMLDALPAFGFLIDRSPERLRAQPVPGVDKDFFGKIRGPAPLPGPFQQLIFLPELEKKPVPFRGPYAHVRFHNQPRNVLLLGNWPLPLDLMQEE